MLGIQILPVRLSKSMFNVLPFLIFLVAQFQLSHSIISSLKFLLQ